MNNKEEFYNMLFNKILQLSVENRCLKDELEELQDEIEELQEEYDELEEELAQYKGVKTDE